MSKKKEETGLPMLQKEAALLLEELSLCPETSAVAVGGSRATGRADEKSDYDIYVYVEKEIPEEKRRSILEKYCSTMEIGNHYWEAEDNCTLKDGVDIDLIYRNSTDKRPVRMEYLDDTDLPEFSQLPTFKRICICILKNDHACKYMGFSPNKSETQRRRKIMEKYESLLRTSDREELPEPCL